MQIDVSYTSLFLFQILLPLRHHLYPSNVAWTEEGHYFSWRMKLRNKQGSAVFHIHNPKTGERWTARPEWDATPRQARKLTCRPDLLLQYAHHLRDKFASQSGGPVKVHADVFCSLNYRPRARLVDPKVDLAKEEHSLLSYDWLLPLTETLPARSGR